MLKTLARDLQSAATAEREDFAVRLQPVPLSELLAAAAAFTRTLPGEHPMTTQIVGPDWVLADPERIGQVLRNLLENAATYSPVGAPIEVRATARGSRMRIEVADRGPGIPPHDRRRIFEKFGRGRDEQGERVPGLGLGLYLSRRLVQMHGSDLTVEPRPGGGRLRLRVGARPVIRDLSLNAAKGKRGNECYPPFPHWGGWPALLASR